MTLAEVRNQLRQLRSQVNRLGPPRDPEPEPMPVRVVDEGPRTLLSWATDAELDELEAALVALPEGASASRDGVVRRVFRRVLLRHRVGLEPHAADITVWTAAEQVGARTDAVCVASGTVGAGACRCLEAALDAAVAGEVERDRRAVKRAAWQFHQASTSTEGGTR